MSNSAELREWLIRSINRHPYQGNPYQYGYIIPIQDREVAVTASGYTAHYLWDISDIVQSVVYEHEGVQVVDFRFGLSVEEAKQWDTVIYAFANLLNNFSTREPIVVDTASIVDAIHHYDRHSEHGFEEDSNTTVQIRYSANGLFLTCSDEPTKYDFPVKTFLRDEEIQVTIRGSYFRNALSGFKGEETLVFRFSRTSDMLAIGTEGDKVAIIMGIVSKEEE